MSLSRRSLLLAATAGGAAVLSACARFRRSEATRPPIVFMHGNGDNASQWLTTVWRFESNGWPRDRLFTVDVPYPLARDDDAVAQLGRSSSGDNQAALAAEVQRALKATGASQVVLMGNSRGGYAIRSYVASTGGRGKVSHAILGGTPNHGVYVDPTTRLGNEFNGAGAFLTGLNAPKGPKGDEVTPGVKWLTLRSNGNDKYAQPDGVWIGRKGVPTGVTADGPALKGATNILLEGIVDHRETACSAQAFDEAWDFVVGRHPPRLTIEPEDVVVLDGKVSGLGVDNEKGAFSSNLPLAGALVEVYRTNPATGERIGDVAHRKTVGADGAWGPFRTDSRTTHEFVVTAPGYAITHVYRAPFPRSTRLVTLVPQRLAPGDVEAKAIVTMTRPRGYFGLPRDQVTLDGNTPPGVPLGVPGVASSKLAIGDATMRTVVGRFNDERIAGWAWPVADRHMVVLELHA